MGFPRKHPHTCFLSLQENAPTAKLPHTFGRTIADPCTTIPACQINDWFIGSASCRGFMSMAKIDIVQDLAAGPEQTNAAQLLVHTETPRKNAVHSHVYGSEFT